MKQVRENKIQRQYCCEIRGHLQTQGTESKLQTLAVDIRELSSHDLREKVDESDNLSHEQK